MTEDVILVAVLTARAVAKRLVRIQKLNSLYREEVETMRTDTVKTTVNALWRRYGEFKRRTQTEPSFVDWLVASKHFERTFADDPENLWLFDAVEAAINAKHNDPDWLIVIETVTRKAIPRYRLKEGSAISFVRFRRPAPEEEGDSPS